MEKLIVHVNNEQKDTLLKLFKLMDIEVLQGESEQPLGSQEKLSGLLDECSGMWKDREIDFKAFRKDAWENRGA